MSNHKLTTRSEEEIFVLYYDGKPLHIQATSWNDWRPPKKVYFKRAHARSGITNLPPSIDRSRVSIVRYIPDEKGSEL